LWAVLGRLGKRPKLRDQRPQVPFFSALVAFDDAPQLYIDPVEYIDCGACIPVCPVSAILRWTTYPRSGSGITGFRSHSVGMAFAALARLALGFADCEARDGYRLAPQGISSRSKGLLNN